MICDTASVWIARPRDVVLRYMSEPANMAVWNIGTVDISVDADGLCRGRSASDGGPVYIRAQAHAAQGLVDYYVGSDPDALVPRIFVRVLPGDVLGGEGSALLMTAIRLKVMDDARWRSLVDRHVEEVALIKDTLETTHA